MQTNLLGKIVDVAVAGVLDSTGNPFSPDSLPQVRGYDTDGNLETLTVTDGVRTWVQTTAWEADGGAGFRITTVSAWVLQEA